MHHLPRLLIASAAMLVSGLLNATPTVEDFVKRPAYGVAQISPDGQFLAITVDQGEQDVLTILRTSDLQPLKVNVLPEKKSIGEFHWISDNRLIFNAVKKMGGYAAPFSLGEWYAVNADGTQATPVIFRGSRDATQRSKAVFMEMFSILDTLDEDPRSVIMQSRYPRSSEGVGTQVVRVDTITGRRQVLATAPKANCSITLDANKEPRFSVCSSTRNEDGEFDERTELYRRDGQGWTLVNASATDGKHLWIYRTTSDGTVYALQDDGRQPAAIGTLDTTTGVFTTLHQDPVAEVDSGIWSTDRSRLIGVITAAGAPNVTLIDDTHEDAGLYSSLAEAFPGQLVEFSSHTRDGKLLVVSVSSDSNPGELYLYDRNTGQARFLMSRYPNLDVEQMASVRAFSFTARDGLQIHAFLTTPRGAEGALPLIVNPHGGPIGVRDSWNFNPEAQLFASRGYATLQINYRGSSGYGKAFQDAGHQQWGEGIQNDIIDATRHLISEGRIDSQRICIYGGSFGGYSALMAPIRAPELFQCAFGYVGVYDLSMMFTRGDVRQSDSGLRYLRRTLGTSRDTWRQNSPAERAREVRIPVYLAAGARDQRTPPEQTEKMHAALVAAGNRPEGMIIQSGEMHGFYDNDNRVRLYTAMLEFFDRHIGQRAASQPQAMD